MREGVVMMATGCTAAACIESDDAKMGRSLDHRKKDGREIVVKGAFARRRLGLESAHLFRVLAALWAVVFCAIAQAQPVPVLSQATDATSNSELMISYRYQEHMWQTPDGALHLLANRGSLRPNPGLVLLSSYDGGVTWLVKVAFARTNRNGTADGQLDGTTLSVVFASADDAIVFAQMSYDSATKAWTVNRTESVYRASGMEAENPALAFDDAGVAWCSFPVTYSSSSDIELRWFYRPTEGSWVDTGVVVGPTDNRSKERSARPIKVSGGMGLIYRVNKTTYWTTRPNGAAPDVLAAPQIIHVGTARAVRSDPYASHFSAVADDGGHLHLAVADDGAAMYLRYSMLDGSWTVPRQINGSDSLSYLQIGLANGQVQLSLSASRGSGAVYLSNDYGDTFTAAFTLRLPPASDGISYKTGRVETVTRSNGTLAVMQQYEDQNTQRLMVYPVPVP